MARRQSCKAERHTLAVVSLHLGMVLGLPKKPNMAMKLGNSILLVVVVDILFPLVAAIATPCACTILKEEDRKTIDTIHQPTNSSRDNPRCEQGVIGSRVFLVHLLRCALARPFRVGTDDIEPLRRQDLRLLYIIPWALA